MKKNTIIYVRASNTGSQNLLLISSDIAHRFHMKNNLKLSFGAYTQRFRININPNLPRDTLIMPQSALIPKATNYHLWETGDNSFRLGPLVVILSSESGDKSNKPFAGRPKFFAQLIKHAQKNGAFILVVTPNGINPVTKMFTGYTLKNNKWYKVSTPLPDVVYNRVPSRVYEQQKRVRWAKGYIATQNIPLFNRHFLNKSELNKIFTKTHLSNLIPETIKWSGSPTQLSEAIKHYKTIYLKPVNSFAGHGILKLSATDRGIMLQRRDEKNNKPHYYRKFNDVTRALQKTKKRSMIIQQGINLATYKKSIFDVRVLTQRNKLGEWQLIGMGCRVAGVGRITTHVPNGGSIAPVNEVLTQVFQQQSEMILHQLKKIATEVPVIIEQYYGYSFGIISMDIGIDKNGHLWLFEANAKPMEFDEEDTQQKSMQTLIEYSKYLTNRKWGVSYD